MDCVQGLVPILGTFPCHVRLSFAIVITFVSIERKFVFGSSFFLFLPLPFPHAVVGIRVFVGHVCLPARSTLPITDAGDE